MTDAITFLGTEGDSLVVGKQMRASGGIILSLEDNQFVLDPGPGCLVTARQAGINIRDTISILVSHNHTNHAGDLNAVIEALTVSGLDVMGVVVCPKEVAEGSDTEVPSLKKSCAKFVERVIILEPGKKISINNITIRPTKTIHHATGAIGFIFETQKYTLGYTSDTGFSDEIADQYVGCDILIINCKNPSNVKEENALSTEDAILLIKRAKPGKAIITHFGIKMLQSDPLGEARKIQRETGLDIIAATDGFIINPSASIKKQASLEEFKK